jgi:hypothetical protein
MAEASALFQAVGDGRGIAVALMQLGKPAYLRGDPAQAAIYYTQALPMAQRISNQEVIAFVFSRPAMIAAAMGRFSRAASLYGAESALRIGLGTIAAEHPVGERTTWAFDSHCRKVTS